MHLHIADYVLWLTSPCLQAGVVIAMRRRGLDRDFPFFFGYTMLQVVSVPCLIFAERLSYGVYFFSYWIVAALSVLLSFAVVRELIWAAFQPFDDYCRLGDIVFRWAMVVVMMAALLVLFSSRRPQLYQISDGILVADLMVRTMLFTLVALVLLSSRYLEISWREVLFGIALGFLGFNLAKVVLDILAQRSPEPSLRLGRINGVVYVSSCVIWLTYATLAVRCPRVDPDTGRSLDADSAVERDQTRTAIEILNQLVERLGRR